MTDERLHESAGGVSLRSWVVFIVLIDVLLLAFATIAAFVLFQAVLYATVSTFHFGTDNDSLIRIKVTGLRLRGRHAWMNCLWLLSNACCFAVAGFAVVYAAVTLREILDIRVKKMEGPGGFLVVGLAWIVMGALVILLRKTIVEQNRAYRKFVHRIGLPYQSDRTAEISGILVGAVMVVAGIGVAIVSLVLMRGG